MLLAVLAFIAVILTCAMFISRQAMLGFACAIFWAVLGAHSYTLSTVPWVDMYYYLFFAGFGMCIFTAFAAYGLREKRDSGTDEDEYVDEKGGNPEDAKSPGNEDEEDVTQPSKHTLAVRERAARRKTGFFRRKKDWGEFK